MTNRKILFLVSISVNVSSLLLASPAISNWPAPAYWSPPRVSHGVTTLSDVTNPVPFVGVTPCRVADTRGNGFTGAYGPPSLAANTPRSFTITGVCGIPVGAAAVSFNFAALNVGAGGDLRVYPAGGSAPLVSTMNYNASTPNIANAAIVPLGTGGAITVLADATTIDLIIDVNGYYSSNFTDAGHQFVITSSAPGPAIFSVNISPTCVGACGLLGETASTAGAVGVDGFAYGTTGANYGTRGISISPTTGATGVYGHAQATTGIVYGVQGISDSTTGGAAGMYGQATVTAVGTGTTFGVVGVGGSPTNDAAGVLGYDQARAQGGATGVLARAGVRGESGNGDGVTGISNAHIGVGGYLLTTAGAVTASGTLGSTVGTAFDSAGGPWGVFASGNIGATGVKHFVEPDPNDPTRVIMYSSLEGPEVGTYFRGTAEVVNHQAIIQVPEDFRIVTDDNGLTVQLTPIGASSNIYVESRDLNRIVVRASRDVTFDYLVQGVRRAFKDFQPVRIGYEFMPRSPDDKLQPYLTEEARRRLIANGTYNPDGTVNMRTAERAGWTKIWADREAQAKAEAARAAQNAPNPH